MPRTAVNLPDPTQNSARAAVNNADDLLSQLAGEELDRLLSEAETNPTDASGFELPEGHGGPDAGEASLDELFSELEDKELPTLAEDDTPPAPPPPFSKAPIAEVPKEVVAAPAAVVKAEQAVAPVVKAQSVAATEAPLSAADALAAEMEADERAHAEALKRMKQGGKGGEVAEVGQSGAVAEPIAAGAGPAVEAVSAPAAVAEEPVTIDPDLSALEQNEPEFAPREVSTPLLVRVLEWMNAPLEGVSEGMRQAMGKIAIITTVNAIGVFVYVLFFRRH